MFNVNFKRDQLRWGQAGRLGVFLVAGMLAGTAGSASTPSPFVPEGTQYAPAGSQLGDQLAPSIAFRANGGCIVWHDNLTDGDGFGISTRRLSGQLSGLSSLRVNQDGAGDQENPQVAILPDGGNFIVWQSGTKGQQRIAGRILLADGRFGGPEFTISTGAEDNRNPGVAVAGDGSVVVVWSADGVDGSMSAVQGRRMSADGAPVGEAFTVNQHTKSNQRDPVVATTGNGSVIIAWISEDQRFENSVDVVARRFDARTGLTGDEFRINSSSRPCTTPTIAGLAGGGFIVAWAEHLEPDTRFAWDIFGRVWAESTAIGSDFRINTRRLGFQVMPKLAVTSEGVLAVYRSSGGDGYGEGIVGQWLALDGSLLGDELVVNTKVAGNQVDASVASDPNDRVVAVWSTFASLNKGLDLAAQRFSRPQAQLTAPSAPFVFAASSSKLIVTWPVITGLTVAKYNVFVNGSLTPVEVSQNSYILSGIAPSSTQSIQISYVLSDGRISPISPAASGVTWGEDDNADGLPDDWQTLHFGSNSDGWPGPTADSDGDGIDNRTEFLTGTDPRDRSSAMTVVVVPTPQGALLSWNTRPGAIYQAQWSINLRDWNDLGSPRLSAGLTDSIPAGEAPATSYYRVNLLR